LSRGEGTYETQPRSSVVLVERNIDGPGTVNPSV